MKARIAGVHSESVTDGPGLRTVLFFQGCPHHCLGCHNPQTWAVDGGEEVELEEVITRLMDSPLISGVTLSGGEPFLQPLAALDVARHFHHIGKDVWGYTGFRWEDLISSQNSARLDLLRECDVLVDGQFEQGNQPPDLFFRGSANQRMIDVKASLTNNSLVLWTQPEY
jgi:anaerobic ribonucleoside-triphosphate reductase activating protein